MRVRSRIRPNEPLRTALMPMDVRYDQLPTGTVMPTPVEFQPGVSFDIKGHLRCADIKMVVDSCDLFATIGSLLCTAHTHVNSNCSSIPTR